MKVIFFSKCSKFCVDFEIVIKLAKMSIVLEIIAFKLVPEVSVKYDKNTCDRT